MLRIVDACKDGTRLRVSGDQVLDPFWNGLVELQRAYVTHQGSDRLDALVTSGDEVLTRLLQPPPMQARRRSQQVHFG